MNSLLWYALAAFGESAGCFAFWSWLRLGKSSLWTLPGVISLGIFALALTRIDVAAAGRAYAAYGGIYILSSLLWLWLVEKIRPDHWDMVGACICLAGTTIILFVHKMAHSVESSRAGDERDSHLCFKTGRVRRSNFSFERKLPIES